MANLNLRPTLSLQRNPITNELFLPLRKHPNVILTPCRAEDSPLLVSYFNDIRVYHWTANKPHPFLREHAEEMLKNWEKDLHDFIREFEEHKDGLNPSKFYSNAPVSSIREVQDDGTELFIGHIKIGRRNFGEHLNTDTVDWINKQKNEFENESKAIGDPSIYWMIGCFLAPSHHGQGIMTDAIDTLLQGWAVPYMGVRRVIVGAFTENIGSIKVFEKNGFTKTRVIDDYRVIRGEMRSLQLLQKEF